MPTEQEKRTHRCCFTGHRPEKLTQSPAEVQQWLVDQINTAVNDGFVTFITGMAMGVDIWAGEIVLRLRETDPHIHLIAVVPWPGFANRWNAEWRKRYTDLLNRADLVRYVSRNYESPIFSRRNKWMVDHSARVIAYYNGADGGTKETLEYAKSQGVEIVVGGDIEPASQTAEEHSITPELRSYPLNLLDAILDSETYNKPVQTEDIPADFDRRLKVAAATIKDDRAYDLLMERFRDGHTLQVIGEGVGVSRERIRQLLNKYLRRMRNPDILRFLNCGIENIPEKSSPTMVKRLEELECTMIKEQT